MRERWKLLSAVVRGRRVRRSVREQLQVSTSALLYPFNVMQLADFFNSLLRRMGGKRKFLDIRERLGPRKTGLTCESLD